MPHRLQELVIEALPFRTAPVSRRRRLMIAVRLHNKQSALINVPNLATTRQV